MADFDSSARQYLYRHAQFLQRIKSFYSNIEREL